MIIAWQTVNAVRHQNSHFTRGFLIVAPGITIKDRLRVLQPIGAALAGIWATCGAWANELNSPPAKGAQSRETITRNRPGRMGTLHSVEMGLPTIIHPHARKFNRLNGKSQ